MAFIAGSIIIGSVVAGASAMASGSKAAGASQAAADASTAESRRQYDQTRSDYAPTRAFGEQALGKLSALQGGFNGAKYLADNPAVAASGMDPYQHYLQYGKNEGRAADFSAPDLSQFYASPDYAFRQQQGQRAIDSSAAARGGLLSGAAVKAGIDYSSNLAKGEYGDYVSRLMQQAGLGQAATAATTAAGANASNNISSALLNNGNARASAFMQQGAGVNSAIQGGLGNYMLSNYLKKG